MKTNFKILVTLSCFITVISCKDKNQDKNSTNPPKVVETPLVETVLSAEDQAALTPELIIQSLKDGNQRFRNNDLTPRNRSSQIKNSTLSQYPKAIIHSCIDSRVPVEDVFDRGIGDLFVGRVAGNIINEDILGSIEYACKVAGAKLILVLGHEHCGAIKSAIDGVELGNITALLSKIKPAIDMAAEYEGEKTASNQEYVEFVSTSNVINNMNEIRTSSPILKAMEDNGEIDILGAMYDMTTGEVVFID